MMFLISGASGMGKSSVGVFLTAVLPPEFLCIELSDVLPAPPDPDTLYRQEAARAAVVLAVEVQAQRKHLVLASDPVTAGELLAVPEAEELDGVAVCVLDADEPTQRERLRDRSESEEALGHHFAFARWMRHHARDPQHMQHVLIDGGSESMRWDRWTGLPTGDPAWGMRVIDTTDLDRTAVGTAVRQWMDDALIGRAPVFRQS
jgi:hypothetical protein